MNEVLYLVVPAFNEKEVLDDCIKTLTNILDKMVSESLVSSESKILSVDDGSKDNTWQIIKDANKENKYVKGISLSRNEGHQKALVAGLFKALDDNADISISIDADLQDDPNAIIEMVKEYHKGFDVVYGVRSSRKKDSFLKKFTAEAYYKFLKLMGVELIFNHADFRLLSKKALKCLRMYDERNLFLRGIIPQIGFNSTKVYYERLERKAGKSKYNLKKMFTLANDGITSFSLKPLQFIKFLSYIFLLGGLLSLIFCPIFVGFRYFDLSIIISVIVFVTGVLLYCLGTIGNYLGKNYIETKRRPLYFIKEDLDEEK